MSQNTENRYPQLIIAAAVLGVSLIICILIASGTWARQRSTIAVTGAATKQLRSDLAVWSCEFVRRSTDRTEALALLKKDLQAVRGFLRAKGIPESDLTAQPASIRGRDLKLGLPRLPKNLEGIWIARISDIPYCRHQGAV